MIQFLMPFHDDIEKDVLRTHQLPPGISRSALIDKIASTFPSKNIVLAENARTLLFQLTKHLMTKAGRPISSSIGTMMCGSVLLGVKDAGPVVLMDCNEHWQQVNDNKSHQADLLLFAGLCGKRMEAPARGHKDQILIDDSAQCFDHVSGFGNDTDYSLFSFGAGKQMFADGGGILWSAKHDVSPMGASVAAVPDWQLFLIASQLGKSEVINTRRRENALYLIDKLKDVPWLALPDPDKNQFLKFTVRIKRGLGPVRQRERPPDHYSFIQHMANAGVEVEDWYVPLHLRMPDAFTDPQYRNFRANELWSEAITLPCHPQLTESDLDAIVRAVKSYQPQQNATMIQSEQSKWAGSYNAAMLSRPQADDYFSALFDLKNNLVRAAGKGKKVLDLGCGTGAHLLSLLADGYDVAGVDYVPEHLESLRQQWLAAGGDAARLRTIAADITKVPEPSASYDVIYSFSTLYYIENIDVALAEIARLLRSGGRAIVEFGNRRSLADIEARRVSTNVRSFHVTPGVMRAALARAGLTVREEHVFQLASNYGGATPHDVETNALLKSLMSVRAADGRMLDEVICSSPILSRFSFRHLFVVEKGPAAAAPKKPAPPEKDVNQAQNLTIFAADLLKAGKKKEAAEALVNALAVNPNASAPALMLASLFEGAEEKRFTERMGKLVERWMRKNNVAAESLSSTHPDRYNPPPPAPSAPVDARYQLMRERVKAAKTLVDLGCGGNMIPEATCAVDLFLDPLERGSGAIDQEALKRRGVRFVHQAIDKPLPFKDEEFDFAYSAHVFEHLTDPAMACEEMMRIAKAGCVITPYFVFDVLSGRTYHRWMMMQRASTLFFFEKEQHEDRPFGSWPNVIDAILNDGNWYKADLGKVGSTMQEVLRSAYYKHGPLAEVCLNWEGRFDYMIVRKDGSIQSSRNIR